MLQYIEIAALGIVTYFAASIALCLLIGRAVELGTGRVGPGPGFEPHGDTQSSAVPAGGGPYPA